MIKKLLNITLFCSIFFVTQSYASTQTSTKYLLPNAEESTIVIPLKEHDVDRLVLVEQDLKKSPPVLPVSSNQINASSVNDIATVSHNNQVSQDEKNELIEKIVSRYKVSHSVATNIVNASIREAQMHNLDPLVILAVIATESSFNPQAKNPSGALGLMQTIPRWHQDKIKRMGLSYPQLFGIEANVKLGTQILKEYLRLSNGNLTLALQRYNGSLKDQSRRYSRKIMQHYNWFDN